MADFCNQHLDLASEWGKTSNSIIVLSVPDEKALYAFCENSGLQYTEFREPDLGYALTAVALHPCEAARRKTSNLPLAMKTSENPEARSREAKIKTLVYEMEACQQTEGMSVLDHGWSVRNYARDLVGDRTLFRWKLPDWFPLEIHPDLYTLDKYTIFHDCGKPHCRTHDEEGQHFPDHARVSSFVWDAIFHDKEVGDLISRDMEIHTMRGDEVPHFCRDVEKARMLAIVGLAELHSNADMFGGVESQSFKIKYKHWSRRAKQIFTLTSDDL